MRNVNLDDFIVKQNTAIRNAKSAGGKVENILRLHSVNPTMTAREIARRTYSSRLPDENDTATVTPENTPTANARLCVRFDRYVTWVQSVIDGQGG